jgi:HAD superfamily hydrolase (TIGR01509 family)
MTYELVIFDNDGVLIDSEIYYPKAWIQIGAEAGVDVDLPYVMNNLLGRSNTDNVASIQRDFNVKLRDDAVPYQSTLALSMMDNTVQPTNGLHDFMHDLPFKYCVASSSLYNALVQKQKWAGVDKHFSEDVLFSAQMVKNGKPAPDLFLHAAKEMGNICPSKCVVIEDSAAGVTAAKAAGMTAIGFTGGLHYKEANLGDEKLVAAGADFIASSYAEIKEFLYN